MRELFEAWVDSHRDTVLAATQDVLRIPSVLDLNTAEPNAPFGRTVADALEHTLSLCDSLGFETENFQGYAGHATYGSGPEIAAMLGHLDVVPPGKDWTVDPWGATIKDGFLWGRGTSDDKGPTFAALWGAKAVMDVCQAQGITLSRRLRLIFGCDEESQWRCMAHYFGEAAQPMPTVAFTPDADFPLVHAEKGSYTTIAEKAIASHGGSMRVAYFESGLRPNMVPAEAVARLVGDQGALELAAHVLAEVPDVTVALDIDGLIVTAKGVSAHGASPQSGDNAAVKLMRALTANGSAFDDLASADFEWMSDLARRAAPDGSTVGIAGRDDVAGPLTCNLGVVRLDGGLAQATFNVRYPVTWDGEETVEKMRASLAQSGWTLNFTDGKITPPLYVPTDQEPVKTLLRVYREHTGDMRPPLAMGGRTYATSVAPVGVAYGAAMPGDPDTAHQADERFGVERLIQCAKIYAHALYEMAK